MVALPVWRIRSLRAAGAATGRPTEAPAGTAAEPAATFHAASDNATAGREDVTPSRAHSRLLALLASVVALMLLVGPGALAASAHSELVSSSPADGAALDAPPVAVDLTFNEEISDAGLQVVAQGPSGPVTLGTPVLNGPQVSAPWPQGQPGGTYTIAYRVVSADGHPIDGTLAFSFAAGAGSGASNAGSGASNAASAGSAGSSGAADGSSTGASPSPSFVDRGQAAVATPSPTAAESSDSGFPLWVPILVVLAGVGVGAGIAYGVRAHSATK